MEYLNNKYGTLVQIKDNVVKNVLKQSNYSNNIKHNTTSLCSKSNVTKSLDIPLCKTVWINGFGVVPKQKYTLLHKLCSELKNELQENIAITKEVINSKFLLEKEIKLKEHAIEQLKSTNSSLETELHNLKCDKDLLEWKINDLKSKVKSLELESERSYENYQQRREEHDALIRRLQMTNDICKRFATEAQTLKTKLIVAENKVKEHIFVIKHLENSQAILSRSLKIKEVEHEILQRDMQEAQIKEQNQSLTGRINHAPGDSYKRAISVLENHESPVITMEEINTNGEMDEPAATNTDSALSPQKVEPYQNDDGSHHKRLIKQKIDTLNLRARSVRPKSDAAVSKQNWARW